jgi:regulator of sigma E protease
MYFLGFMSYLSLSLFFINLLPLPVLDGGHLLLLGLEKVRRRRLTERQVLVWQQIGIVFFGCLTVLLVVKDVLQLR